MTRPSHSFLFALFASLAAATLLVSAIALYQHGRTPPPPDTTFMRSAR